MAERGRYVYEWPRPMVTTDAVVFALVQGKVSVLLVERGRDPYKGRWAIPGGFVELNEQLEDAARRELQEETGLTGVPLEQMHTFGDIGRDPRGRQITIVFMGILLEEQPQPKAGDDAAKARWFDIRNLPGNIAFDHSDVLAFAIGKLKRRKAYRLHIKPYEQNH